MLNYYSKDLLVMAGASRCESLVGERSDREAHSCPVG